MEGKGEGGDAALATGKELLRILHAADEGGSGGDVAYADLDALSDSQNDEGHSNRDAGEYYFLWGKLDRSRKITQVRQFLLAFFKVI